MRGKLFVKYKEVRKCDGEKKILIRQQNSKTQRQYSWNQAVSRMVRFSCWRVLDLSAKGTLGMQVCPRGSHREQEINQK